MHKLLLYDSSHMIKHIMCIKELYMETDTKNSSLLNPREDLLPQQSIASLKRVMRTDHCTRQSTKQIGRVHKNLCTT